jgi:nitroreductase
MTPEDVNLLLQNRRSIYPNMFSGEAVPEAIIRQMLENANWAPTHKLTEPWRFTVFSGKGLQKLADFQSSLYESKSRAAGTYDEKKHQKLQEKPLQCSHIISIGMQRDPKERIPEVEEIASVACAVQNMYLTAAANGVGCYWGSGGVTYMPEALEFFGLQAPDRLLGFLYIGMPKTQWPKGRRHAWEEKVRWITE